jgi:hypothetical protein
MASPDGEIQRVVIAGKKELRCSDEGKSKSIFTKIVQTLFAFW